jgi:aminopeptidase
MLTKGQLKKYADVLLWGLKTSREGRYKNGDIVMLHFELQALKFAEVLQGKLIDMGINPVLRLGMTPIMEHNFFEKANNKQLVFTVPGQKMLSNNLNGSIHLRAPDSLTHLRDIDPKKIGKTLVSQKPLRDILSKREEKGLYGWTLCMLPTEELSKKANLTLKQYSNQIIRACYLNKPDPVSLWQDLYRDAINIKKWLNSMDVKHYHIESTQIDLKVTPGNRRKWIGLSGHNIPSFEIFTSPDWRGTEGVYYADQPSFRSGNYVEQVKLTFKKGSVTKVEAKKGVDFVKNQLAMDKGARRIGEFSLTDKRFSKINKFMANTLFDENYGGKNGNCHLAVGSSYTNTYDGDPSRLTTKRKDALGFNDSALHWDLVNTEKKTVTAHLKSGKTIIIYEKGMFTY